jgi:hypothetical protein
MDTTKAKKNPVKLTKEQWQEIRTRWENDPRDGYFWLVTELSLSVTNNTILVKAKREGWTKLVGLKMVTEQAHRKADSHFTVCVDDGFVTAVTDSDPNFVTAVTNETAVDLRASIIEEHRNEWSSHRTTFTIKAMTDYDIARTAKLAGETLRIRQEGERKAWGLDINVEDTSSGMSTDSEMEAIYSKAMAESKRMQKEVEKRNRESE